MSANVETTALALGSKGHEDLMRQFEAVYKGRRFDREPKGLWSKGYVYADGQTNELFIAFRHGAAYGLAVNQQAAA